MAEHIADPATLPGNPIGLRKKEYRIASTETMKAIEKAASPLVAARLTADTRSAAPSKSAPRRDARPDGIGRSGALTTSIATSHASFIARAAPQRAPTTIALSSEVDSGWTEKAKQKATITAIPVAFQRTKSALT
jgi:hypothetical protein